MWGIKNTTLIQNKQRGGIGLQDIDTKIKALRIKFIGEIVQHQEEYPVAHYYMGMRLLGVCRLDNSIPHSQATLPQFYKECARYMTENEHLIHKNTKEIYTELIIRQEPPTAQQNQTRIQISHNRLYRDIQEPAHRIYTT